MLVFGLRYRQTGQQNHSVRADTVESALLAVGAGIANLGQPDPRKTIAGGKSNHPLLASFLKSLRNQDDPAKRSYPANIPVIRQLYEVLDQTDPVDGLANQHVINLTIIAFYWLLRPAEYTYSRDADKKRSQAFRLCDTTLTVRLANGAERTYFGTDSSLNEVEETAVLSGTLIFTDQKNGVRGEQVAQRATSDPLLCPAKALFRLTKHLRLNGAPSTTPLCAYYDSHKRLSYVKSTFITNGLRHSANSLKALSGIDPFLLSARSLRPGGATALLCAGIDSDVIKLLGRWKSDAMFRYLRIQSHVANSNIAQKMLDNGSYTFAPGVYTADADMPLPEQTPAAFAQVLNHFEIDD